MKPTLTVNVDLCNPGQVFACCGLFELAHRLCRGAAEPASAWFDDTPSPVRFHIAGLNSSGPVTLQTVINQLKACELDTRDNGKEGPIRLGNPFDFVIDWRKAYPQNRLVKTWAGGQSISTITPALLNALGDNASADLLSLHCDMKGKPTGFDISRSEGSLDAGFAMDDTKQYSARPPAILELLALIGLQRFCPSRGEDRLARSYQVWREPMTIVSASLAVSTRNASLSQSEFCFTMFLRDSGGRFKSFNYARPVHDSS